MGVPLWFLLILGSALLLGLYDAAKKHAVNANSVMPVLFLSALFGAAFFVLLAALGGTLCSDFALSPHHLALTGCKSLLVSASWIFVYYAMRELPISIAAPIRASAPLWTFIGSLFCFGEFPSALQALGMALTFAGYLAFSCLGQLEGFSFTRSKGMWFIILGTLLGAGSALFDKYLLNTVGIPARGMQLHFSLDLLVVLGAAWLIRAGFGHKHPFTWRWSIPLVGILLIAADYLYFNAVSRPGIRISILSLVRRSNCIVAFAFGVWFFHDVNVKRKAGALVLILLGVAILALAG